MKAARINEYGDVSVVHVTDIEQPPVAKGQILVGVKASSLNPFDSAIRAGYMQQAIPLQLPVTLGGDIAGEVLELGDGVENVTVGDTIYGQANVVAGNSGAFAEFAVTSARQVALAPSSVSITDAASLPLVGVSALQALTQHLDLRPGQKLFVTGGAGGIGRIAIQIAKDIGAYVATTVATEDIDTVKELGADRIIDYKSEDFSGALSGFDAVFDTVGSDDFSKTLTILREGGIAVSMAADADEATAQELNVTAIHQMTHVTTDALDRLRDLVESGIVTPSVGKIFTLDDIQAAFTARETGSVKGKVVLKIRE